MRFVLPFFALLLLVSCQQRQPDEISLKYIPVKQAEYWGYIDQSGNNVIAPQFDRAFTFREGLALVRNSDHKYGFIDEKGQYKIQPAYKDAGGFSEGLANVVKENQRIEYIDRSGRTEITLDGSIETAYPFKEGVAMIRKDEKYGYIDKKGKIIIPAQYEEAGHFSEGKAYVVLSGSDKDQQYGYINKEGKLVINPQFERAGDFKEGMAMIKTGKKYGFISESGKISITPQFDEVGRFRNGLAPAKQGDLWGFIDKEGKWKINPQFKYAYEFTGAGIAAVKPSISDKWGFTNKKGETVIEAQFESVTPFFDGVSIAELNGKYGVVDSKGKYKVNPQYEDCYLYGGDYASIESDYFDIDGMIGLIFNKYSATSFKNISKGATFRSLQKEFPSLNHENYYRLEPSREEKTDLLKLDQIGIFCDRDKFMTSYDTYNDDAPLEAAVFKYKLRGKAEDRKKEILKLLKDAVPSEMQKEYREDKYILLHNNNYYITMLMDSGDLLVAVSFSRDIALPRELRDSQSEAVSDSIISRQDSTR